MGIIRINGYYLRNAILAWTFTGVLLPRGTLTAGQSAQVRLFDIVADQALGTAVTIDSTVTQFRILDGLSLPLRSMDLTVQGRALGGIRAASGLEPPHRFRGIMAGRKFDTFPLQTVHRRERCGAYVFDPRHSQPTPETGGRSSATCSAGERPPSAVESRHPGSRARESWRTHGGPGRCEDRGGRRVVLHTGRRGSVAHVQQRDVEIHRPPLFLRRQRGSVWSRTWENP